MTKQMFHQAILQNGEFNIPDWVNSLTTDDLGKLSSIVSIPSKTGNLNKLLKPHMQFVKQFEELKDLY
jgi:hypothetical protein